MKRNNNWQDQLRGLEAFVDENIKSTVAYPHPDDLFDAVQEGHFELSARKSKSGHPEVWSTEEEEEEVRKQNPYRVSTRRVYKVTKESAQRKKPRITHTKRSTAFKHVNVKRKRKNPKEDETLI